MEGQRVLVAGAAGFIGRAVVDELQARGHRVRALCHLRAPSFAAGVETVHGDVTEPATLRAAVDGCTAVVDAVQLRGSPVEQPRRGWTFERVDLGGVRNLLDHARACGVRRFVYVSGTNLAEHPELPSHRAKAMAERAIAESGVPYTFVKPSLVAGEGSHPVQRLAAAIKRVPFIPLLGDGSSTVQPVYVGDLARLVGEALDAPEAAGRAIEIGGPEVVTMRELMLRLAALCGVRKPVLRAPPGVLMPLARLAELLPRPPLSRDALRFLLLDVAVDDRVLFELFPGFALTPLDEALRRSLSEPR